MVLQTIFEQGLQTITAPVTLEQFLQRWVSLLPLFILWVLYFVFLVLGERRNRRYKATWHAKQRGHESGIKEKITAIQRVLDGHFVLSDECGSSQSSAEENRLRPRSFNKGDDPQPVAPTTVTKVAPNLSGEKWETRAIYLDDLLRKEFGVPSQSLWKPRPSDHPMRQAMYAHISPEKAAKILDLQIENHVRIRHPFKHWHTILLETHALLSCTLFKDNVSRSTCRFQQSTI